jgi:inner membrane protein
LLVVTGVGAVLFGILAALHYWITPFGAIVATAWLAVQAVVQARRPRPAVAWASVAGVFAVFLACSWIAQARARHFFAQKLPDEVTTDIVTTPAPANPLCWRVIAVTAGANEITARLGTTSLALVNPDTCFAPPDGPKPLTVRLSEPEKFLRDHNWSWVVKFERRLGEFDAYSQANRRVAATREFLRVPFWGPDPRCANGRVVVGDLRLDYDPEDLASYCKYSFPKIGDELLENPPTRWAPPFFPAEIRTEAP